LTNCARAGDRSTAESEQATHLDAIAELWSTPHQLPRMGAGNNPGPTDGTRRALLSAVRSNGINILRPRSA